MGVRSESERMDDLIAVIAARHLHEGGGLGRNVAVGGHQVNAGPFRLAVPAHRHGDAGRIGVAI